MGPYEREEQQLEDDLNEGHLSPSEYNQQMKELQRDYRDEARESAQDAYDQEMQHW